MRYDYELILIKEIYIEDEIGNQIPKEIRNEVFCGLKSIGRNEYYKAASEGLKPVIIFVIHNFEYDEEKEVIFEEKKYRVIRTYSKDFEKIELTCEKVIS